MPDPKKTLDKLIQNIEKIEQQAVQETVKTQGQSKTQG